MERNFKVTGEYKDINDLSTAEVIKTLAYVNSNDKYRGTDFHEALLDVVMNLGLVKNRIENYMPYKMYGFYGKNEIGFVYSDEYLSLDLYMKEMKNEIRELFKGLKLEKVASCNTPTDAMCLLSAWLGFQLKDANKKVVLKYAQMKYPDLTQGMLALYVSMRKATDYKVDLDMSNEYILKVVSDKNANIAKKLTWSGLNHLKRIFGYPEEIDEVHEKKQLFVTSHRNEILFWCNTGACMIPKEDYRAYCSLLKSEFSLTENQFQKLYDWCLRCKYQGQFKTDDSEIKAIRQRAIARFGVEQPINKVFASGFRNCKKFRASKKFKSSEILPVVLSF